MGELRSESGGICYEKILLQDSKISEKYLWKNYGHVLKFGRVFTVHGICTKWMSVLKSLTRVGTLIVGTIYLQLLQNRYMFRSFTVLQCSHQHCVQHVASDVEVVGYF